MNHSASFIFILRCSLWTSVEEFHIDVSLSFRALFRFKKIRQDGTQRNVSLYLKSPYFHPPLNNHENNKAQLLTSRLAQEMGFVARWRTKHQDTLCSEAQRRGRSWGRCYLEAINPWQSHAVAALTVVDNSQISGGTVMTASEGSCIVVAG